MLDKSMCRNCVVELVARGHGLYCSDRCMRAWSRRKKKSLYDAERMALERRGYDLGAEGLFDLAHREMLYRDPRVWNYRLILDLIDGQWSRSPLPRSYTGRATRSVVFPEPNRRSHVDSNGLRRSGDFFMVRPFEWPVVPLDAYYRVQLLGFCDAGEPLELDAVLPDEEPLFVRLPASPFNGRWTHKTWGRPDPPGHRVRQQQRRQEQKAMAQEMVDMGSNGHDPVDG